MILDSLTLFDEDVAKTAVATTYSDIISVDGAAVKTSADAPSGIAADAAKGTPLFLLAKSVITFVGSGNITVSLETSTDEAFTSPVTLETSGALVIANLKQGAYLLPQVIPYGVLQYLRVKYVVVTGFSAGKVTCALTTAIQSNG
jgi:hypothetical protein